MSVFRKSGAVILLTAASALAADDAESSKKLFNELFGPEITRVERTPSPTDDIELAGRLWEAVDTAEERPTLVKILCETTVRLASKEAKGYPTAIAAQERLIDLHPDEPAKYVNALLDLRYRQVMTLRGDEKKDAAVDYVDAAIDAADRLDETGDIAGAITLLRKTQRVGSMTGDPAARIMIGDRLRTLASKQAAMNQAEQLKKKLRANPDDQASAEELIRLCIVDLDDPAEAFKYSMLVKDAKLKANVKTATLEVGEVAPNAAMDAAGWYLSLVQSARENGVKLALLERSGALYDRYLDSEDAKGLRRTKAELDRKKIDEETTKIEAAVAKALGHSGGPWVDALKGIDMKDYTNRAWTRQGKAIVSRIDDDEVLELEAKPEGSYEYRVKLARMGGPGHIGIIFTVPGKGWQTCTFVCQGADGEGSGLERINGRTFARNPSSGRGGWLPGGKTVTVRVVVKVEGNNVEVSGYVGSKRKTKWKGPASALSNHWTATSGKLGVVADHAKVAVVSAEYRSLDK